MRRALLLTFTLALAVASTPIAQHRLQPITTQRGEPALELMLRKLDTVGNFMMTTAHPDDENNAMLAYYAHGNGFRTSLVAATRGEGGQNEIGPELFEALAVLRTEELLAAHRFDGAEQFFTRAVDFGFSFSVAEAFRAAADPAQFPEQLAEGLRPWQASKFYYTAGFGGPGGPGGPRTIQLNGPGASKALSFEGGTQYDRVLGRTYNELAGEARSMHKCQGMS